jgi:hypothetical protein
MSGSDSLGETTPLLLGVIAEDEEAGKQQEGRYRRMTSAAKEKWNKVRTVMRFRRTRAVRRPGLGKRRVSVRGSLAFPFYASAEAIEREREASFTASKPVLEPVQALSSLVRGGTIRSAVDGTVLAPPHHVALVKSVPAYTPYCRKARHRNFHLWWLNEFRHWWKSSRLLVRIGGLETLAREYWISMVDLSPTRYKQAVLRSYKYYKHLGQGGPMRGFMDRCQPITRSIRITVGAWRWIESAPSRRLKMGVEETMVRFSFRPVRPWNLAKCIYVRKLFCFLG